MQGPTRIHNRMVTVYDRLIAEGFTVQTPDYDVCSGDESDPDHSLNSGNRVLIVVFPKDGYHVCVCDDYPDNDEPLWVIAMDYFNKKAHPRNRKHYTLANMGEFIARMREIAELHK